MHVLIVEDDQIIAGNIQKMIKAVGNTSTIALSAEEGIYQTEVESFDVIILDWTLPDQEGIEVCKILRDKKNTTPIIMLTAKSQVENKIEGLSTGADDYLTKPFAMEELLARLKALVRRGMGPTLSPIIEIADLVINTNTHEVTRAGQPILLAPREYTLLEYLALHPGEAIERVKLLHHVWGEDIDPFSNTIDVHIRYLRKKIDDNSLKKLIKTVKNKGYLLCKD